MWRGAVVYNSVEVLRQPCPSAYPAEPSAWTEFPSMRVARCGHQATVTNT